MDRPTRVTTASVLLVVSLVAAVVGVLLLARSRTGLTAHLFLPESRWLEPAPAFAPLGPETTDGLDSGLRLTTLRWYRNRATGATEILTGVQEVRSRYQTRYEGRWRGYLEIPEAGVYGFALIGSHDVTMLLDGRKVGGLHPPWLARDRVYSDEFTLPLEAGLHTLVIDQLARDRVRPRATLALTWAPPGEARQRIPSERLWSDRGDAATEARFEAGHLLPDAPERPERAGGHLAGVWAARPEVRSGQSFVAMLIERWDHDRFRRMSHFPGYRVLWRGRLRVTDRRVHQLRVETAGAVRVHLGGSVAEAPAGVDGVTWTGELAPGWHDLAISFVSPWPDTPLGVRWDGEGGEGELGPISPRRLRPLGADRAWTRSRRAFAWSVVGLAAVALLAGLAWLGRLRALAPGELAGGLRRGAYALALCGLVLLGLGLRLHRYAEVPHQEVAADEYHNARKGWHILHGEGLRGWTPRRFLDFYQPEQIDQVQWNDVHWHRVNPNFDRPPLFPLLLGLFDQVVDGAETVWEVRPSRFRLFPILLSVACVPLVAALTRRLYGGRGAALLAALLFAAVPSIVLNQRQAKSDTLVVLCLLLGILAALKHVETGRRGFLWAAAAAAGLAPWSKEIGIVALAVVPYVWLRERRWREGLTVAAVGGGLFALYFAWGSWVDYDLFWNILGGQASQASSFAAAWTFLTEARVAQLDLLFAAGWTLWLWLAVAYAAPRDKLPALAAVCFLIVISSLVRIEWIFGWYWVPIYPFLCMAGGVYLYDLLRRPDLVRGALFVLTVIFIGLHAETGGGPQELSVTRGAVAVSLAPFAIATFFPNDRLIKVARVWAAVVVAAALVLGAHQLMAFE